MNRAPQTCATALLLSSLALPAQEAASKQPKLSRAQKQIAALAAPETWDAAATRLVLMGTKAAPEVGAALGKAAREKKAKVCSRLLLVLERMGLAASSEVETVLAAQADMDPTNAGQAFLVAGAISPIGDKNAATAFKNAIRNVMTMLNPNAGGQQEVLRQFTSGYNTSNEKSRILTTEKPEQAIQRVQRRPPSLAVCQRLGQLGAKAQAAAPALAKHLVSAARRPNPAPARKRPAGFMARRTSNQAAGDLIALCLTRIARGRGEAALAQAYLMQHDKTEGLRRRAAQELMMAGPHLAAALPILTITLTKGRKPELSPEITCIALNCLAMLGDQAKAMLPRIDELTESRQAKVAARAQAAAKRIRAAGTNKK